MNSSGQVLGKSYFPFYRTEFLENTLLCRCKVCLKSPGGRRWLWDGCPRTFETDFRSHQLILIYNDLHSTEVIFAIQLRFSQVRVRVRSALLRRQEDPLRLRLLRVLAHGRAQAAAGADVSHPPPQGAILI